MSCPPGPFPDASWTVWRGAVPGALSTFAVQCLSKQSTVPYGYEWTTTYEGAEVLAVKQHHTWTYRGGKLITGICIPGITLYRPRGAGTQGTEPDLSQPDPSLAWFDSGGTDWAMVAITAGAILGVAVLFALAVRKAGRLRR